MTEPRDPQPLSRVLGAFVDALRAARHKHGPSTDAEIAAELPAAFERMGLRLVDADAARPTDGLREALRDLPRYVAPDGEETYVEWDAIRQLIEEETALPTSEPHVCPPCEHMDGPLDVERLARALVGPLEHDLGFMPWDEQRPEGWRWTSLAADIAREYGRGTQPSGSSELSEGVSATGGHLTAEPAPTWRERADDNTDAGN